MIWWLPTLKIAGSGFGTDTNVVTMISKEEEIQLELLSKAEVAHKILDEILKLKGNEGLKTEWLKIE